MLLNSLELTHGTASHVALRKSKVLFDFIYFFTTVQLNNSFHRAVVKFIAIVYIAIIIPRIVVTATTESPTTTRVVVDVVVRMIYCICLRIIFNL